MAEKTNYLPILNEESKYIVTIFDMVNFNETILLKIKNNANFVGIGI